MCIEPLGAHETDFITSSAQGMELVALVNHPNVRLQLCAKVLIAADEDYQAVIRAAGDCLKHFHAGDPGWPLRGRQAGSMSTWARS